MFSGLQKAAGSRRLRNRVLETIIVIRPITVTILITDLPPRNYLPPAIHAAVIVSPTLSLSCRHNNDRTAAVITRKCNFSIGNYHGVSFSGVIATNLAKMHNILVVPDGSVCTFHGDMPLQIDGISF